jgi:hypothetical protein
MFERLELRPAHRHALMSGGAEFFGGALLALGLLTPLAAAILIAVMTAAVITVHAKNGIWNGEKGFEYNLVLSTVAFTIACIGAGSLVVRLGAGARPGRRRLGACRAWRRHSRRHRRGDQRPPQPPRRGARSEGTSGLSEIPRRFGPRAHWHC